MHRLPTIALLLAATLSTATASAATTITDAQGITYAIPDGWKAARRATRGVTLTPPNGSSAEAYIAMRWDWGFTKADRKKIQQKLDRMMSQTLPHLKRTGDAWLKGPHGAVVVINYEGLNSNGTRQRSRYYIASMGQFSIAMMCVGNTDLVAKRAKDCRSIFLSAVQNRRNAPNDNTRNTTVTRQPVRPAGNVDRQLVGRWVRTVSNSSIGLGSSAASQTTYTFVFQADGTCILNVATWVSASSGGSSALSGPGRGKTYRGKWTASNGEIVINYADGSNLRNNYRVFQHLGNPALKLALPGGKPVYYHKR